MQTRDFRFASDVIDALALAAEAEWCGETFNIGAGSTIRVNTLIEEIERFTQKGAQVNRVAEQKGDVTHTSVDISKAQRMLG